MPPAPTSPALHHRARAIMTNVDAAATCKASFTAHQVPRPWEDHSASHDMVPHIGQLWGCQVSSKDDGRLGHPKGGQGCRAACQQVGRRRRPVAGAAPRQGRRAGAGGGGAGDQRGGGDDVGVGALQSSRRWGSKLEGLWGGGGDGGGGRGGVGELVGGWISGVEVSRIMSQAPICYSLTTCADKSLPQSLAKVVVYEQTHNSPP
jgi:hypothetical protein